MNHSLESASVWDQVAPLLEEAMNRLGARERDAVVLRFLEERSFAEVASALGTTEAAAKMRVGRALERLRAIFARRGVVVPTTMLIATFSAHGVSAAPAGLSAAVAAAALMREVSVTPSLSSLVKAALKIMTWNKIKMSAVAIAIVLLLTAGFVTIKQQGPLRAAAGRMFVANLDPMAGEWEGTFESRGNGLINPVRQPVTLSVSTTKGGRSCEIEMRLPDNSGRPFASYHFTHTVNDSGNRILTIDDPQIARMAGDGVITESLDDRDAGVWRAAFRTPHADGAGFSECQWVRKGDELNIARHDRIANPQGWSDLFSDLSLRRRGEAKANP
jgi:hypothetical protein